MSLPGSHTAHISSSLVGVGSQGFHYCNALKAKAKKKKIQFATASVTLCFNQMDKKESLTDAQTD